MKRFLIWAAGAAVGLVFYSQSVPSFAYDPQLFFDQTVANGPLGNPPFTLGWDFTTNAAITVNGLGVFDSGEDGLADSYEVGLWDSAGNLLAETTVSSGISDPLVNQWRYSSVAPVTLAADQNYSVGALYLTGDDNVVFPGDGGTVTTTANITYGQSTFASGSTLSDPTNELGTNGFFGPNISADVSAGVPEPSTWALMLLGFTGLGFAGHWRARARGARLPD